MQTKNFIHKYFWKNVICSKKEEQIKLMKNYGESDDESNESDEIKIMSQNGFLIIMDLIMYVMF